MLFTINDRNGYPINMILRYIYHLWETIVEICDQITEQVYPTSYLPQYQKETQQQRRYTNRLYIGIIICFLCFIIFIINFIVSFLLSERSVLLEDKLMQEKIGNFIPDNSHRASRYIYIDIGCFNGETIEYFTYFTHNSEKYEIYTFEPDPENYRLCKKRLSEKKFEKYNINIIQKVAWIRNEKVYFRTERGRQSRISLNITEDDGDSIQLEAIDFSAWFARLVKRKKVYVHMKISMPGAEVPVLEKMIRDDTLGLANKYEIEWTDRENPLIRATRIYVQLMFDSYGFDGLYYTRLQNIRKIYQKKGSIDQIEKYYDWREFGESDALAYYVERPDEPTRQDT